MPKPTQKTPLSLEAPSPSSTDTSTSLDLPKAPDPFRIWKTWQPVLHAHLLAYFGYNTFADLINHLKTATPATNPKLCKIIRDWNTNAPIFNAIVRHHIFPDNRTLVAIEKALQISPLDKISQTCKSAPTQP